MRRRRRPRRCVRRQDEHHCGVHIHDQHVHHRVHGPVDIDHPVDYIDDGGAPLAGVAAAHRRLGPGHVGMTLDQAQAAAAIPLQLGTTPYCRALAAPALGGVHFIATNDGGGTIDVITVNAGPVATVSGIRIGSTRAEVLATYGDQVTVVNERRIVYRARDPGRRGRTLVFVIDNGEVASMYAGNESHILTDELCA